MKLVESKVEFLPQGVDIEDIYKQIELCGRTCYKSGDKITKGSAEKFVDRMISSNHTAMLEHGAVYLTKKVDYSDMDYIRFESFYSDNPYSRLDYNNGYCYVSTNFRVLVENGKLDDLEYLCDPCEYHEMRYTFRILCDIHIYKDLTRQRPMSYAIESTRFCNYLKEKFGMSISFLLPSWVNEENKEEFEEDCKTLENIYFKWINKGLQAQEAAYFLCQGTAAEICVTGFESDWGHVLDLRYFEKTGKVLPDLKIVMDKLVEEAKKYGLLGEYLNE